MSKGKIKNIPRSRIATMDTVTLAKKKNHNYAIIEADITGIREELRDFRRKTGDNVTFLTYFTKCVAHCAEKYPEVISFLKSKKKQVHFEDINITIMVEKRVNGGKVPFPYLIKQVNQKKLADIGNEIYNAVNIEKNHRVTKLNNEKLSLSEKFYFFLPGFIRRFLLKKIIKNPSRAVRAMGSVIITSLGMFSKTRFWIVPVSIHPLCFALGSITKTPGVIDNEIQIRQYLNFTVLIDHDVVDGAIAARFINYLVKTLQSGELLTKE